MPAPRRRVASASTDVRTSRVTRFERHSAGAPAIMFDNANESSRSTDLLCGARRAAATRARCYDADRARARSNRSGKFSESKVIAQRVAPTGCLFNFPTTKQPIILIMFLSSKSLLLRKLFNAYQISAIIDTSIFLSNTHPYRTLLAEYQLET